MQELVYSKNFKNTPAAPPRFKITATMNLPQGQKLLEDVICRLAQLIYQKPVTVISVSLGEGLNCIVNAKVRKLPLWITFYYPAQAMFAWQWVL